jgi:glycosyltransferase involved in cell wall biosynthesis
MSGISAVIITMNEEESIGRCLSSLEGIADEIIVVDSHSTDSTEEICKKFNVRFVQNKFEGFMNQKNYAVSLASNKYVLSLDADEALSEELRKSIREEKKEFRFQGYYVNRLNNYCGKWIRHSGWYPDRQLRLFEAEKGRWGLINVHETFQMNHNSRFSRLKGDLLHWPHNSDMDLTAKIEQYSEIAAREMFEAGEKVNPFTPYLHGSWRFLRTYIVNMGFLDGRTGYQICSSGALASYLKYSKLVKLHEKNGKPAVSQ